MEISVGNARLLEAQFLAPAANLVGKSC